MELAYNNKESFKIQEYLKCDIFEKVAAYADGRSDDKSATDFLSNIVYSYLHSIGLTDITFHKVDHEVDGYNNFQAINITYIDSNENLYTVYILEDLTIEYIKLVVDACEDTLGNCSFTTITNKTFMINKTINFDLSNISIS